MAGVEVRGRVAQSLAIDAHTAQIVAALREAGIPSVLLKGPAIARWLYTDGTPRPYGDTDLLVPDHRIDEVERVIEGLGLVRVATPTLDLDRRPHATYWALPDGSGSVDLHWTVPHVGELERAWEVVWRDAEPMTIAGGEVLVGSEPLRALHIALHAVHHGPDSERTVEDLRRAVAQVPHATWASARGLADELGAVAAMALGLQLLPEGAALALRLGIDANAATPELLLLAEGAPVVAGTLTRVLAQPTWRGRARLARVLVFPPAAYLRAWDQGSHAGVGGTFGAFWRRLGRGASNGPASLRAHLRLRRAAARR